MSLVPENEFVSISSDSVEQCLLKNGNFEFVASKVHFTFAQGSNGNSSVKLSNPQTTDQVQRCTFRFIAHEKKAWLSGFRLLGGKCSFAEVTLYVWDGGEHGRGKKAPMTQCAIIQNHITPGPIVLLSVERTAVSHVTSVEMNFTTINFIETAFDTPNGGYIQLPWDADQYIYVYSDVTRQVLLKARDAHVIMMSFSFRQLRYVNCFIHSVRVHRADDPADTLLFQLCGTKEDDMVTVFHSGSVYVRFVIKEAWDYVGFRTMFSYHELSVKPQKLPGGMWNCSVPNWPEFQQHFLCNLVTECAGGEDERNCPYSGHCGPHKFTFGEKCYEYIDPKKAVSWNEAQAECVSRGGYLVSLNTQQEQEQILHLLSLKRTFLSAYVGLKFPDTNLPYIYSRTAQWSDTSIAYNTLYAIRTSKQCSTIISVTSLLVYLDAECDEKYEEHILCEDQIDGIMSRNTGDHIHLATHVSGNLSVPSVVCRDEHVTHTFLACDLQSACWVDDHVSDALDRNGFPSLTWCPAPLTSLPPSFLCRDGQQHVPYTLVCDHRKDCVDQSDEDFCFFPLCSGDTVMRCSSTSQCLSLEQLCDGQLQCSDASDEDGCNYPRHYSRPPFPDIVPPPATITFLPLNKMQGTGFGYKVSPLPHDSRGVAQCPETHFKCVEGWYCMPVYVRCNGVRDCPGNQDEEYCDRYMCPGFFHCRSSTVCLHLSHVCDGILHCPQGDDEVLCDQSCPPNCTCNGLAFICHGVFPASDYPNLRFLIASRTSLSPRHLLSNKMLVHLSLVSCGLNSIDDLTFPNLHILDLSDNAIYSVIATKLTLLQNLKVLRLSGNPLKPSIFTHTVGAAFESLVSLDLSRLHMSKFNSSVLQHFTNLQSLNLSDGNMNILVDSFQSLDALKILDIRKCPISSYPRNIFDGLTLEKVYSDDFKLCCPALFPDSFNTKDCTATSDAISSCDRLISWPTGRVLLSLIATGSTTGNVARFAIYIFLKGVSQIPLLDMLILNINVCDFLMGLSLVLIGVADRVYEGNYFWHDVSWRQSFACKASGFLSLLSSLVSSFITLSITLCCVVCLYRNSCSQTCNIRISALMCGMFWSLAISLATVPHLPMIAHWQIFSQSGTCVPMVASANAPGHAYSFGVLVVLNSILSSVTIAAHTLIGHALIYHPVTVEDPLGLSSSLSKARSLFWMTLSHCLCRLSVIAIELLASSAGIISNDVKVALTIVLLPSTAVINPAFYVLGLVMEKQRRVEKERLLKYLKIYCARKRLAQRDH